MSECYTRYSGKPGSSPLPLMLTLTVTLNPNPKDLTNPNPTDHTNPNQPTNPGLSPLWCLLAFSAA